MKVEFWQIGKTSFSYIEEGAAIYEKRLKHYLPFQVVTLPGLKATKKTTETQIKTAEAEQVLKKIQTQDYLILLDERGKSFSSEQYAKRIETLLQQSSSGKLIVLLGGAYGFTDEVYKRANEQLSLSEMTFSHQMIRVFFLEQLYRAMTILRNEPYHHS